VLQRQRWASQVTVGQGWVMAGWVGCGQGWSSRAVRAHLMGVVVGGGAVARVPVSALICGVLELATNRVWRWWLRPAQGPALAAILVVAGGLQVDP
jgi:hypothetical protein